MHCHETCSRPRCSKRGGFADWFEFPELQGSVNSIDSIGSLRFPQVVGETSDKVASLSTNFVGSEFLLHVESLDGVAAQILDDFPKLYSAMEKRTVKSSSNMLRGRTPAKFAPQRKRSKLS